VLAVVMAAFVLHTALHLEPSVMALLGAGLLVCVSQVSAEDAIRDVEWPTLVFFMGRFVMVGALTETGVIEHLGAAPANFTEGRLGLATVSLLWVSAILSALVDNIPYVSTMSPIVDQLVEAAPAHGTDPNVLWWALALGADLGGNATAVGASANAVVLGVAASSGHRMRFWEFTKYGLSSPS
jgi:Na+/H+ antiporter NhaD/arsenite permease-like protein